MGQLQTICSMKLNTAIFSMFYVFFYLRSISYVCTIDIEDIAKCELIFIYISIIIVTYKRNLANLARTTGCFGDASFVINLITQDIMKTLNTIWGNILEKGPYGLDNQHLCFGLILKFRSYGIQK